MAALAAVLLSTIVPPAATAASALAISLSTARELVTMISFALAAARVLAASISVAAAVAADAIVWYDLAALTALASRSALIWANMDVMIARSRSAACAAIVSRWTTCLLTNSLFSASLISMF